MIVYQDSLKNYIEDVSLNRISDKLSNALRSRNLIGGSPSEVNAWDNSLHFMKDVLDVPGIPQDCSVAVEYNIPQTSKRVDFMLLGRDKNKEDHIVIVELKQWAKVEKIDDISLHSVMSDLRSHEPVAHPSYQAYSYKSLIMNYCNQDNLQATALNPCAYLHNMPESYRPVLEDSIYSDWIEEAPVFLKNDVLKLREFIKRYICLKSANDELLYNIDFGRIRPTKALQDALDSMLCGNEEFFMIDDQAVAYDFIMKVINKSQKDKKKRVVVITGGPGTGKSVLAVNVLVDCVRKLGLNASYITKNSAPRNCYARILAQGNAKKQVCLQMLFKSPHSLPSTPENGLDVGIFDEAHRMVKKPYMYKGNDMLSDAMAAARVSVFFVDEDQRITTKDIYTVDSIYQRAEAQGAVIESKKPFELKSQFRCGGSDGYISFLTDLLGIADTANKTFDIGNFDLRVYDSPQAMKDALRLADKGRNKSRMAAGYCYDWNVKNNRGEWDVVIGDFKAKWNLPNDESFAINPNSFNEIGCIHTVQGMEFDYAGVIIGKDLLYRDGKVITDRTAESPDDKTSGIRTCRDAQLSDTLIRNTYKVLLTRGQKGCFIYCEDDALRYYLKQRVSACCTDESVDETEYVLLPVVGEVAAGHEHFTDEEIEGYIRVEKSRLHPPEPGKYFFLRVDGDSMIGADIDPGDYVLIRRMSNPRGDIKEGNVIVCRTSPELATLKTYYKSAEGVRLHPENSSYEDIMVPYEEFMIGNAKIIGREDGIWTADTKLVH